MSEKTVILGDDSQAVKVPLMTLREVVMFPRTIVPLYVGRKASIRAVEQALEKYNKNIFLVTQKNPGDEEPGSDDLFEVGVVCKILQMMRMPDGTIKVLFEGSYRARWSSRESLLEQQNQPFPVVEVERVPENVSAGTEVKALINLVQGAIKRFAGINKKLTQDVVKSLNGIEDPGRLADMIMSHMKVDFNKAQKVLETMEPVARLEEAYGLLLNQIEYSETEQKINSRVKEQVETNQKNYYLNEQLKAIQKEMGTEQDSGAEADELLERLEAKAMSEEAREKGRKEISKLRQIPPSSAEYTVVRNYVDCILDLPWDELKETCKDIDQAARILDEDHFGLEKPKERILEYLAVQTLVEKLQGQILCFVGPPGVGKTSLAKSIARATDREFTRLSLGGVRDEAEIRGHRRTYIGALPGKIIQSLKRKDYNNPVICLDEVDKMSTDFRGDPSSALLEVLDPEQNYAFSDHYLDLDYDLSNVFFITTANTLHSIPWALRDRMEIIRLPGYLETEKTKIARSFLLPKQLKRHGLKEEQVHISDGAVQEVIRKYTREAGVRNLERELASIYRKVAKKIVQENAYEGRVLVNKNSIPSYLGVPSYRHEEREDKARVGLSVGLAWTEMGGELLMIEAVLMAGTGKIEVTGTIGDVMQESAKAALSYIRSRASLFGLRPEFYKEVDIHLHIPEGATPKDGPSAGVAMMTSVASAFTQRKVKNNIAMTGEITLRGKILPVGGIKEKILAAKRAGVTEIAISAENRKDVEEIKDIYRQGLRFEYVQEISDLIGFAAGRVLGTWGLLHDGKHDVGFGGGDD